MTVIAARQHAPLAAPAVHRRQLFRRDVLVGALVVASALVALLAGRAIQRSWNTILDENVTSVRAAADLHLQLFQQKGLVAGFLLEGDERWLEDLEAGRRETVACIERLAAVSLTPAEAAIAGRIRDQYRLYDERRQEVIDRVAVGHPDEARRIYLGDVTDDVARLGAACEELLDVNERLMAASRQQIAARQHWIEWCVGLGAAGVLLVGTFGGWIIARDVERRQAALERMAALGQVTSALAHEVRNPLTAITLRLESLDAEPSLPPVVRQDVQVMRHEIGRLERLVTNILLHSQLPQPRPGHVPVAEVVDRTLELLRPAFQQQGVLVESRCRRGAPSVLADAEQLSQVLLNVELNALQVMPDGGRLLIEELLVAGHPRNGSGGRDMIEIRVQDSGPGIPAESRAQVCEPFFTTRRNGLGLGLSIVSRIVASHSGSLAFESAQPTGTTVVIRLPCAHPPGETA